jgi:hypothetical protein
VVRFDHFFFPSLSCLVTDRTRLRMLEEDLRRPAVDALIKPEVNSVEKLKVNHKENKGHVLAREEPTSKLANAQEAS